MNKEELALYFLQEYYNIPTHWEDYKIIHNALQENQQLKEQLQQKENIINKAIEYNKQIIKDVKEFYRPTSDRIYSGNCLIDLAEINIGILDNKGE